MPAYDVQEALQFKRDRHICVDRHKARNVVMNVSVPPASPVKTGKESVQREARTFRPTSHGRTRLMIRYEAEGPAGCCFGMGNLAKEIDGKSP